MHLTSTAVSWIAGLATPSPSMTVDPDAVTPTIVGFGATALVAAAVVFLVIDMLRRIRRAGYRADIAAELDAEAEAAAQGYAAQGDAAQGDAATEATGVDDQDIDGGR